MQAGRRKKPKVESHAMVLLKVATDARCCSVMPNSLTCRTYCAAMRNYRQAIIYDRGRPILIGAVSRTKNIAATPMAIATVMNAAGAKGLPVYVISAFTL